MTFPEFVRFIRHNLALLLGATLLGLLGGAVYSLLQPTLYTASATGAVVAGQSDEMSISSANSAMALAASKAKSYIVLVDSGRVQDAINAQLKAKYPGGARIAGLSASSSEGSNLFTVNATAPTAQEAQDIANAALEATANEARRLDSLRPDGTSSGKAVAQLVPTNQAKLPQRPVSPTWLYNLPIGAAVGLTLGFVIAFMRRSIDSRVRTQDDVDEVTGSGVLGIIPKVDELAAGRGASAVADVGITAEALRQLRTNLRFVSVDNPPTSIVISSANPGEGKSTVSANVARVLAQAGSKVVLIDADLRRPTQAKRFGLDNTVGLTQVLSGEVPLEDALQETDVPGLEILPSGRIPPNPSELVGSQRMRLVIDALAADRMVLIDAPPVLPVTDAGLLAAASDGLLLVLRVGNTRKEQVRQVMRLMRNVNARLLGSVLNMTPRRALGTATYGYGYGGYGSAGYGAGGYASDDSSRQEPEQRRAFRPLGGASRATAKRGARGDG